MARSEGPWRAALYTRLSREDGDKPESDSIANQRALLRDAAARLEGVTVAGDYSDDGCTGTNFDRPEFQRMLADITAGTINCVMVKDLSRFGRDYIRSGHYLERWFPAHGVRFVAVNDHIDSLNGPYDLMLPFKNVFNEQYARDISQKVRSAMAAKRRQGAFIGAFACYGYRKDPEDHSRLVIDPCAAPVVRRIFTLFQQGRGQLSIARQLNDEGIPCPSVYKALSGERYRNGRRLEGTSYWTYATIHRILRNQMYIGNMEQGRAPRQVMHGRAVPLDPSQWTVVEGTHTPIIPRPQWDRVQALLARDTRSPEFGGPLTPFAGFLRCGDCGRAMSKTLRAEGVVYVCGSYKRYGPAVCSRHAISQRELEQVVLEDLNRVLAAAGDLHTLASAAAPKPPPAEEARLCRVQGELSRVSALKQAVYEDFRGGLLTREEYCRYREDYTRREAFLSAQLDRLEEEQTPSEPPPWVSALLARGSLTELDRLTVAEAVEEIRVFADGHIAVTYRFADPDAEEAPC